MKFKKLKGIIGMAMVGAVLFSNTAVYAATAQENQEFTWDNASVYFTITDRFKNGDTSNDHAYGRSVGEVDANSYQTRLGTFHGGDLKGLKEKVDDGYFDDLGINAIWITAPYEQIHGALSGQGFKHYSYHGYYTLDYTNVDGNMGTAQDLENFIDAAHSHGIRVIFDVVMNHAGYADAVTANEYGFGKLSSNWKDIYYNTKETDYNWYNDYTGEAANNGASGMMDPNGDWSTNWWGPDWIRAVSHRFNGYTGSESGDEKTMCLSGLPDFKTESTNEVALPGLLKTKWQKEGRYDQEMAELNSFFSRTGKPKTVTNYLVKWLSDWVREYGVDGFRCDTAKHVDISCWAALKDECKTALKEWRQNNPDKPGANWDEDFWMTGEHYDHHANRDYYFDNGFDSMINFDYMGLAFASPDQIEGTYSDYARKINSDSSFNLLSYISSHDKGLSRGNMITAGTNLLLLPGGIQIFYGDETARPAVGNNQEQSWRSQMNWDSIDTKTLAHWQKVGQFRKNHIAVGAGTHTKLSSSPYTFSRTYDKNGLQDKVVVAMPGTSGATNVSVENVFNDGDGVRDAYTGKEYIVSNGSVSVDAGENGLVLLESNGSVSPAVGLTKGQDYYSDTLKVTLSAANVQSAKYSINGGEYQSFENGQTITIGEGVAVGESTTVTVIATDAEGNTIGPKTEVYNKIPEPEGLTVYVKNDSWTSAPNIYVYTGDGASAVQYTGAWPGEAMTPVEGHDGWYKYATKGTVDAKVIFNGSWGQYPAAEQPGIDVSGTAYIQNNSLLSEVPDEFKSEKKTGTVTVKYVDEDTLSEIASSSTMTGNVGDSYSTSAKTIDGYTLSSTPSNASGSYIEGSTTVTYKYKKNGTITQGLEMNSLTADVASPVKVGTNVTFTANTNKTEGVSYKFWAYTPDEEWVLLSDYSNNNSVSWTPNKEGNYIIWAYAKDEDGNVSHKYADYKVTEDSIVIEDTNSSLVFSGTWENENDSRLSGGTGKYTNTDGSSLSFLFKGNAVKILATSAADRGVAKVTLDGKVYSADMYNDTTKYKDVVFEKRDLSSDIHKLILEYSGLQALDSTGTTIGVDSVEIVGGNIL